MNSRKQGLFLLLVCWGAMALRAEEAETAAAAPVLTVVSESGKAFTFALADLKKLPQLELKVVDHHGEQRTFSGVALAEVLKKSEVALGSGLKGKALGQFLVAEATDKYRVLFSLPEIDPEWSDNVVLLATARNGEPLDAAHGPIQLVAAGDKRHSRWVKQLTRITIRQEGK
jgi:DMSO/TMAO reductase YedYZ molybdopterin-dependent catalytic subunit